MPAPVSISRFPTLPACLLTLLASACNENPSIIQPTPAPGPDRGGAEGGGGTFDADLNDGPVVDAGPPEPDAVSFRPRDVRPPAEAGTPAFESFAQNGIVQIYVDFASTCVVREDHAVVCWGESEGLTNEPGLPSARYFIDPNRQPVLALQSGPTKLCAQLVGGNVDCVPHQNLAPNADLDGPLEALPGGSGHLRLASSFALARASDCWIKDSELRCRGDFPRTPGFVSISAEGETPPTYAVSLPDDDRPAVISGGADKFCVTAESGAVFCFFDASVSTALAPRLVPSLYRVDGLRSPKALVMGSSAEGTSTCGLTQGGEVFCFSGLGLERARLLAGFVDVAELAGTPEALCARLVNGVVICRGNNELGQLGRGAATDFESEPGLVDGLEPSVRIAGDGRTFCSQSVSGVLRCWGGEGNGQLGRGLRTVADFHPIALDGPAELRAGLKMGDGWACAVQAIPTKDFGPPRCWGRLRADTGECRAKPTEVKGFPNNISRLVGGGSAPCALRGREGQEEAFCLRSEPRSAPGAASEYAPPAFPAFPRFAGEAAVDGQGGFLCRPNTGEDIACVAFPLDDSGPFSFTVAAFPSGVSHLTFGREEGCFSTLGGLRCFEYALADVTTLPEPQDRNGLLTAQLRDRYSLTPGESITAVAVSDLWHCAAVTRGNSHRVLCLPSANATLAGTPATDLSVAAGSAITSMALADGQLCVVTGSQLRCAGLFANATFEDARLAAGPDGLVPQLAFQQVASGDGAFCALSTTGEVFCRGNNKTGLAGAPPLCRSTVPVQLRGGDAPVGPVAADMGPDAAATTDAGLP